MALYKKPFLKTSEVAQLFSVNPSTVFLWVKKGKLRPKKTLGGNFRFSHDQVQRLWEQQQSDSTFVEEKRKEPRFSIDFPVSITIQDGQAETTDSGVLRDISGHGVGLIMDKKSDVSQKIINKEVAEVEVVNKDSAAFKDKVKGKITHLKETEKEVKIGLKL